jgi:hypothetical protein
LSALLVVYFPDLYLQFLLVIKAGKRYDSDITVIISIRVNFQTCYFADFVPAL